MRSFLVGFLFLVICNIPAFGQASGFVEKIGFGKAYRPYGWTPVLVSLQSQIGEPAEYQIQVRQEDLDSDRVVFRRDIVLNPGKIEKFWVYFLAQPRGLGGGTPAELDKLLDVRLCTKSGKPLARLRTQDPIINLDPPRQGFGSPRGEKLVLMVLDSGGRSTPAVADYQGAIGINEDVRAVPVTPFDLPENAIGYDAVDAVVWLDADSANLTSGGSRRLAALTDWVRRGGRLVVSHPTEAYKLEGFADLLPIELKDAAGDWSVEMLDRPDLEPIRTLATYHTKLRSVAANALMTRQRQNWDALQAKSAPFKVAFAGRLRDGAVGEEWLAWDGAGGAKRYSPWLARRATGFGSVTWVAQDLGNPAITGVNSSGWPYVWDRVLGQRNLDMRVRKEADGQEGYAEQARAAYYTSSSVDLGASFLRGMDHEGRAGGLVFLAGVFFVGYWVVAGPIAYVVLAGRKRTDLSWTVFAVSALAATLLTVGIVRLVLRGEAEVHHVSLVRMLPSGRTIEGEPKSRAFVDSRIGLYIPRDYSSPGQGAPVTLLDNDPQAVSFLTPYSIHPAHAAQSSDFPAFLEYEVPVRDGPLTEAVTVKFPYRSTLKKLQAHWVGDVKGGIEPSTLGRTVDYDPNKPRVVPSDRRVEDTDAGGQKIQTQLGYINGRLVNRTGADLAHVYIAFHHPALYTGATDYVFYRPTWADGESLDLGREFNAAKRLATPAVTAGRFAPGPGNRERIQATISEWEANWYDRLKPGGIGDQLDDSKNEYLRAFPMLSLYDRLKPAANEQNRERVEVLRRAARDWDVSELVAAGQLVILAQRGRPGATSGVSPLPFPLEVEGEVVEGTGTTFYQFALPLDRSELPKPGERIGEDDPDATTRPVGRGVGAPTSRPKPAPAANETPVEN